MTNNEFCEQIAAWQRKVDAAGVRLSSGDCLPDRFWHVFLGYSHSAYKKMKGNETDSRPIKPYVERMFRALNRLEHDVFIEEVESAIPGYESLFSVKKANK